LACTTSSKPKAFGSNSTRTRTPVSCLSWHVQTRVFFNWTNKRVAHRLGDKRTRHGRTAPSTQHLGTASQTTNPPFHPLGNKSTAAAASLRHQSTVAGKNDHHTSGQVDRAEERSLAVEEANSHQRLPRKCCARRQRRLCSACPGGHRNRYSTADDEQKRNWISEQRSKQKPSPVLILIPSVIYCEQMYTHR
jgi:hypothetical protein